MPSWFSSLCRKLKPKKTRASKLAVMEKTPTPAPPVPPKMTLPTPLFALIIGINKYAHFRWLSSAVKDANRIEEFLLTSLSVPPENIIKLLDGDATKSGILETLKSLGANSKIHYGDAILIYFAGHGARGEAPQGWDPGNSDGMIEMICPCDMSQSSPSLKNAVTGIPDVVIGALIMKLAEEKGDNIALIFDCCHSANANRDEDDVSGSLRVINDPPPVLMEDINYETTERGGLGHTTQRSLECSVLLSACQRDEQAQENKAGGLFTQSLLGVLMETSTWDEHGITYVDLVDKLKLSDRQHPQCEGVQMHRYLFRTDTANQSFISGSRNEVTNSIVLQAGKLLGIEVGAKYDIYSRNVLSPDNLCLGSLTVSRVDARTSYLSLPPSESEAIQVPTKFYALLTCFAQKQKIPVYTSDTEELKRIMSQHQRDFYGFVELVDSSDKADLLVSFRDSKVNLNWHADNPISIHTSLSLIGHPIPASETEKILNIFQAAAKFHYYLRLGDQESDRQSISLKLHKLEEIESPVNETVSFGQPVDDNILEQDEAFVRVNVEKDRPFGPLGLTILNHTRKGLFPHVFWFDGRNLTIVPWYTDPSRATSSTAPLPACWDNQNPSRFPIGYGEGSVGPWGFRVAEDASTPEIGFFLIFLANFPEDLSSLAQVSPFSKSYNPREGFLYRTAPNTDWWTTRKVTVVQVPV